MPPLKDLTGMTFGRLTVLERAGSSKYKDARWLCQCECGSVITVNGRYLRNGDTMSCGCFRSEYIKPPKHVLSGQTFGLLTAIKPVKKRSKGEYFWLCQCACGNQPTVRSSSLMNGNTKSCGCLKTALLIERSIKHNCSHERLYSVWLSMNNRCARSTCKDFKHYGGRGITVCEEWKNSFVAFRNWALENGYEEGRGLSIDRINTNSSYSPENCRWVTQAVQTQNQRRNRYITFNGETKCLSEWERETGINRSTIASRLNAGVPVEQALTTPRYKLNKP